VKKLLCATVGAVCLISAGCSKKVAVKAPPPVQEQPTRAAAPSDKPVIALFAASPGTIDKGPTLRCVGLSQTPIA